MNTFIQVLVLQIFNCMGFKTLLESPVYCSLALCFLRMGSKKLKKISFHIEFATELEGGQAPHCPILGGHMAWWYG